MNEKWFELLYEHLDSIIALAGTIVTAIGFVVAIWIVAKEFKNSLKLQQIGFATSKLENINDLIYECYMSIQKGDSKTLTEYLKILKKDILSFGSEDAINILMKVIEAKRHWKPEDGSYDFYVSAHLFLLMAQMKKDLTGIEINPKKLFVVLISDYEHCKSDLKIIINKTVDECNLSEKFKL